MQHTPFPLPHPQSKGTNTSFIRKQQNHFRFRPLLPISTVPQAALPSEPQGLNAVQHEEGCSSRALYQTSLLESSLSLPAALPQLPLVCFAFQEPGFPSSVKAPPGLCGQQLRKIREWNLLCFISTLFSFRG